MEPTPTTVTPIALAVTGAHVLRLTRIVHESRDESAVGRVFGVGAGVKVWAVVELAVGAGHGAARGCLVAVLAQAARGPRGRSLWLVVGGAGGRVSRVRGAL